jgi:hypothetical protein
MFCTFFSNLYENSKIKNKSEPISVSGLLQILFEQLLIFNSVFNPTHMSNIISELSIYK